MGWTKYLPTALGVIPPAALTYSKVTDDPTSATAAIIVGGIASILAVLAGAKKQRDLESENARLRRVGILGAACQSILDLKIINCDEMGFHAFRYYARTLKHPRLGEHMRVARHRPKRPLVESPGRWSGDKGAIGFARTKQPSNIVWWRRATHPLGRQLNCTAEQWDAIPEHDRMGFTHEEWLAKADRYSGVIVAPVVRPGSGSWLGCITLDCATDEAFLRLFEKKSEVDVIFRDAANSMAAVID